MKIDYSRFHLYVGNLPTFTYRADVVDFFESRGFAVAFAWIVKKSPRTDVRLEKAHCFVQLSNPDQISTALRALDMGEILPGHRCIVRRFVPLIVRQNWQQSRVSVMSEKARAWQQHTEAAQ
jgi:RNA recognition motif-containing protein